MTNSDNAARVAPQSPLDADRSLVLAYAPASSRPSLSLVWELDTFLGNIVVEGRQPLVVQMKLAWWRQALAGLDDGQVPAQPLLARISDRHLSRGITGRSLAGMVDGWERLLAEPPISTDDLHGFAVERGSRLFSLSAIALEDTSSASVERGGAAWSLVDLARRSSLDQERREALGMAAEFGVEIGRLSRRLRPLAILVALARRDLRRGLKRLEPRGSPTRVLALLRAGLTGR